MKPDAVELDLQPLLPPPGIGLGRFPSEPTLGQVEGPKRLFVLPLYDPGIGYFSVKA